MKKIIITIISFIFVIIQVNAESGSGEEYKDDYEKGITQVQVSNPQYVTLYGKSICNGTVCPTVEYAGQYSNFEDALSKTVVCTNGEKNIMYQEGGSGMKKFYDASQSQNGFSGTMYWAEDYYVTCTKESSGNSTIKLENTNNNNINNGTTNDGTSSGGTTNDGTSSGGTTNGGTSSGGTNNEYNSSTTVDPSETGVTTYFIVLGLVAIISYIGMIFIKRYNLFKNI